MAPEGSRTGGALLNTGEPSVAIEDVARRPGTEIDTPLRYRLMSAMVRGTKGRSGFFPKGVIIQIVTEDAVKETLTACRDPSDLSPSDDQIAHHASEICGGSGGGVARSSQRIFAILVLMKRAIQIYTFLDQGVCDDDLPLLRDSSRNMPLVMYALDWPREDRLSFYEWQRAMLVPFFASGAVLKLPERCIMPWTKQEAYALGYLDRIEIHPLHYSRSIFQVNLRHVALLDSRIRC